MNPWKVEGKAPNVVLVERLWQELSNDHRVDENEKESMEFQASLSPLFGRWVAVGKERKKKAKSDI